MAISAAFLDKTKKTNVNISELGYKHELSSLNWKRQFMGLFAPSLIALMLVMNFNGILSKNFLDSLDADSRTHMLYFYLFISVFYFLMCSKNIFRTVKILIKNNKSQKN